VTERDGSEPPHARRQQEKFRTTATARPELVNQPPRFAPRRKDERLARGFDNRERAAHGFDKYILTCRSWFDKLTMSGESKDAR